MARIAPPVLPPADWFADPGLFGPSPLTVTREGRILGHVALWADGSPRSATGYANFHVGEIMCDDGQRVAVGRITIGSRPGGGGFSPIPTVALADDVRTAIAEVVAGNDKHGMWVSGAVVPDITPRQLSNVLAAEALCGWVSVNGGAPELIAIGLVQRLDGDAASIEFDVEPDRATMLVASGTPTVYARSATAAHLAVLSARVDRLVGSTRAERNHDRLVASLVASSWGRGWEADRLDALYRRVHGHPKENR